MTPSGEQQIEKTPETITLTKDEYASLQRQLNETRESEKFWATKARGAQPQAEEPEEEEIDTNGLVPEVTGNDDIDQAIFEDPDKWTEAISKGPKAIGQYIKTLGLVSGAEAAEIAIKAARQEIQGAVRGMQADSKLVGDFSDMRDPNSDLFKAAAPIYKQLVELNGGKQTTALLYAAAGQAKATLAAKAPKPKREDDPYERYDEEDRQARADAQGARRGKSAPVEDDSYSELGPEALAICKQMNISTEDYQKSQKELGTRRRR